MGLAIFDLGKVKAEQEGRLMESTQMVSPGKTLAF